jgi:hypothetical protein
MTAAHRLTESEGARVEAKRLLRALAGSAEVRRANDAAFAETRALPAFHPDTQGAFARSLGLPAKPKHVEADDVAK